MSKRSDFLADGLPAGWRPEDFGAFAALDAGANWIARRMIGEHWYSPTIAPDAQGLKAEIPTCEGDSPDARHCYLELYEDGSAWEHSNAQDTVWADWADYVAQCLDGQEHDPAVARHVRAVAEAMGSDPDQYAEAPEEEAPDAGR